MLIYNLTHEALVDVLLAQGYKKYRADQIWNWLYKKKVSSFQAMSNLPEDITAFLEKNFTLQALELVLKHTSTDGTMKCLYSLVDG
ncbi:MAG: 23S rRNA (adenine(2503)-C(2))-methyltransferase RlmN, partial [Acholeplasmataceae bacterium]|nr:23S rRNA (adenine(2503)-C(2))-methyltransferase RlmN [Acholeplasmataceae bacterium]